MKDLIKIQNELKVPKGNVNKFGNYKYRSAEDILEAVKPVLLKYNAFLFLSDKIVMIGPKIFLEATATLKVSDEIIAVNGYAETCEHKGMSAEQSTGTASSYARKYALNGLFLIDETESDPDSKEKTAPQKAEPANTENKAELLAAYKKLMEDNKNLFSEEENQKAFTNIESWDITLIKSATTRAKKSIEERIALRNKQ